MKRSRIILLCAIFFFLIVRVDEAQARHRSKVLGTSVGVPSLPPTVEGPGFILPDSPLFFLDRLKQDVNLFLAITPEAKAKVRSKIAGERLAELRFMLAKQDPKGIDIALSGVSDNIKEAAAEIERAQLAGKNVTLVAKEINDSIKKKQEALDSLEEEAGGELKAKVAVVSQGVLESKVKIEDALPEDQLQEEIEDDLERNVHRGIKKTSDSARDVVEYLEELQEQEKEAARKSLKKREEAIKKAIEEKNEELRKDEERLLEYERKKNDELLKLEAKEALEVKETVQKAQEAALKLNSTRKEVNQVKTQPVTSTSGEGSSGSGKSSKD
ncbi:MAG: hypothetical protein A3F31_04220 [Candidatus Levybacteria bacterium RIFCSPHIGHO2_12_FULL_38_12]|nr:MAG: hypothetical protein A3F31_04220 [Candidatus Levybacteria bacterium RIFCSPHIGHO2_12_FULL_38_12]OGH34403.1 MAG: hypothetical protein A3A47_04615 [Candidatus Levybacteria bacterium RIFCSPLOWO2_01_FULL_37_20]OGH44413.1 MAG: hypothetical protein A3J14_03095 [Candidatus Levybacteria bacterium RIFCSPLOWO2_02_FULL_37_18]